MRPLSADALLTPRGHRSNCTSEASEMEGNKLRELLLCTVAAKQDIHHQADVPTPSPSVLY